MSFTLLFKALLRRKLAVALLLIQLAVTLALIVNSSLLALHARNLLARDTGLDLTNTLMIKLRPTAVGLTEQPALSGLLERQLAALRETPGVVSAAYISQAPLQAGGSNSSVEDVDDPEHIRVGVSPISQASVDIFDVLGLRVVEGELPETMEALIDFARVDVKTLDIRQFRAVITESLAKRLYGSESAVGRYINHGRIVAVVSDFFGHEYGENSNFHVMNIDHLYNGGSAYVLMVRTQPGMADSVLPLLAERLRAADTNVDISVVRSLADQRDELYRRQTGLATLLAVLSGAMVLVAMISAYSNAFFHALQQRQEIGIKRALGADKQRILRDIFAESWLTTGLGCGLGLIATFALNYGLSLVLSIPPVSLWLPLVCILVLLVCVTLASWYPARVAVAISPVTATKAI